MQGIEAQGSIDEKVLVVGETGKSMTIGVIEDKAAKHKKEFDKKVSVGKQAHFRKAVYNVRMKKNNSQSTKATKAIEYGKSSHQTVSSLPVIVDIHTSVKAGWPLLSLK